MTYPQYGYPQPPKKSSNAVVILVILGVVALALFGGCAALVVIVGSSDKPKVVVASQPKSAETARATEPAPSSSADAQPATATVGGSLTLEGMDPGLKVEVEVSKVADPATPANDIIKPKTGSRYVAVELRVKNVGQAVYGDSPSNGAHLIDDQGQQYNSTFGEVREGVLLGSVTVSPGDSRKGVLLFEVPEGVKLAKFQFALNSGFASQKGEWTIA